MRQLRAFRVRAVRTDLLFWRSFFAFGACLLVLGVGGSPAAAAAPTKGWSGTVEADWVEEGNPVAGGGAFKFDIYYHKHAAYHFDGTITSEDAVSGTITEPTTVTANTDGYLFAPTNPDC